MTQSEGLEKEKEDDKKEIWEKIQFESKASPSKWLIKAKQHSKTTWSPFIYFYIRSGKSLVLQISQIASSHASWLLTKMAVTDGILVTMENPPQNIKFGSIQISYFISLIQVIISCASPLHWSKKAGLSLCRAFCWFFQGLDIPMTVMDKLWLRNSR